MMRQKGGCLAVQAAFASLALLVCAGCISNATPGPPTAGLVTATVPQIVSPPAAASATAIFIVTATGTDLPEASATAADTATAAPTNTLAAAIATSTPIASETATGTQPATAAAPASLTPPPQTTAAAVGIIAFAIAPQTINPGDSVTLTWQATGQQAAIYRQEPGGPLTDMHTVALSGTLTLKTPDGLRNRVDYVLYAGAGGSTASATVSAVIRCPDKYFFANAPTGCPSGPGTLGPMASEHFEHGVMVWASSQNQITILFADDASPAWMNVPNQWTQGQPESDPSIVPPSGLFQPVRGFGAAWRSSEPVGGRLVRDRLGWATETEAAMTGGFQCDSMPKYSNCFLSGPGGVVYWLKPEFSAWEVWKGP